MATPIDKVASGFRFTEGPVWHPGGFLLFSDIPANKIWQLNNDGTTSVFMDNSGLSGDDTSVLSEMVGSNGLAIAADNSLIICQHGNHALIKRDADGTAHTLATVYNGRPFNSPNDVAVRRSDGAVYFTDPPYGLKDQVLHPREFQPHAGIYQLLNDNIFLISTDLRYPNGVCFSPGEKFLYVSSNHPEEPFLMKFGISDTGTVDHGTVLANHNADGITTDHRGNLYLCTDDGIVRLDATGKKTGFIPMPESPSNITWGGNRMDMLYITARTSVYRINPVFIR